MLKTTYFKKQKTLNNTLKIKLIKLKDISKEKHKIPLNLSNKNHNKPKKN